jgi:hypothetical protein
MLWTNVEVPAKTFNDNRDHNERGRPNQHFDLTLRPEPQRPALALQLNKHLLHLRQLHFL